MYYVRSCLSYKRQVSCNFSTGPPNERTQRMRREEAIKREMNVPITCLVVVGPILVSAESVRLRLLSYIVVATSRRCS